MLKPLAPSTAPVNHQAKAEARLLKQVLLMIAALFITACFKLPAPQPRLVTTLVVVLDQSTPKAEARRCGELSARLDEILGRPGVKRLHVLVLGTGDQSTGFEPDTVVPWTKWSPDGALFEHPDRAVAVRREWLASVRSTCEKTIRARRVSPIFTATDRAVASLNGHCSEIGRQRSDCQDRLLALHSDLRENAQVQTREALRELSRRLFDPNGDRLPPPPVPRIDTKGIDVRVCGIADTSVGQGERLVQPSVVIEVWKWVLGVGESAFDSSCPTSEPVGDRAPEPR